MNKTEISSTVIETVNKFCKNKAITTDTDLLKGSILDSITFVRIITEFEQIFSIKFDILDLSMDNFKNINIITEFLINKLNEANN